MAPEEEESGFTVPTGPAYVNLRSPEGFFREHHIEDDLVRKFYNSSPEVQGKVIGDFRPYRPNRSIKEINDLLASFMTKCRYAVEEEQTLQYHIIDKEKSFNHDNTTME